MSTAQKYGTGNSIPSQIEDSAANPPQMGATASKSPSMPDSRQPILSLVSDDLYSAQVGVLRVVDEYLDSTLPVEHINDLLYNWLITDADLAEPVAKKMLTRIFGVVNFLTDLKSKHEALQFLIDFQKGGVDNE